MAALPSSARFSGDQKTLRCFPRSRSCLHSRSAAVHQPARQCSSAATFARPASQRFFIGTAVHDGARHSMNDFIGTSRWPGRSKIPAMPHIDVCPVNRRSPWRSNRLFKNESKGPVQSPARHHVGHDQCTAGRTAGVLSSFQVLFVPLPRHQSTYSQPKSENGDVKPKGHAAIEEEKKQSAKAQNDTRIAPRTENTPEGPQPVYAQRSSYCANFNQYHVESSTAAISDFSAGRVTHQYLKQTGRHTQRTLQIKADQMHAPRSRRDS